jgi:hypothetical protein
VIEDVMSEELKQSVGAITEDDIRELIGIAMFLKDLQMWEARAYSRILAEIAKRLLATAAAPTNKN